MSWFSDLFNPPAQNIPLPQFGSPGQFGVTPPSPYGYTPPPTPTNFMPTGMPGAEQGALGGIGGLSSFQMYNPALASAITGGMINNPGMQGLTGGAQTAAGMGQAAATGAFGAGGGLMGLGGQIAGTAFDPQQDLYNRTLGQVTDASRAASSARGLGMSPFGAGLENDATRNFNIDWQNQQLQRQIQGGQAAGNLIGAGAGLQAGAPGQYLTASGMPYSVYQQIGANQMGALGGLQGYGQQAAQLPQQQIQNYMNYLQMSGQLQSAANAANMQAYYGGLGGMGQAFSQAQIAGFQDPMQLYQQYANQQQQTFQDQLNREKQASQESSQMWGNLGKLGGTIAGSMFGGPMGGAMGGALGGALFGGGGGGQTGMLGPTSGNWASPYYAMNYSSPSQLFPGYTGGYQTMGG